MQDPNKQSTPQPNKKTRLSTTPSQMFCIALLKSFRKKIIRPASSDNWIPSHYNAPAHSILSGLEFLANNTIHCCRDFLVHLICHSDFLLLELKVKVKGNNIETVCNVEKTAAASAEISQEISLKMNSNAVMKNGKFANGVVLCPMGVALTI